MKNIAPVFVFLLSAAVVSVIAVKLTDKTDTHPKQNYTQNETQDAEKAKTPEFYIDGELPDIGEFTGAPDRFYPDYTPDFIPSPQYGKIIPFTGSYKVFSSNALGEEMHIGYSSYGFCTEDGKIVMDAADKNQNIIYTETNDGFGFYTLAIVEDPQKEIPDDIFLPQRSVIIPESGAWSIDLGNGAWINEAKNGMISVTVFDNDSGRGECILYDYDGNELSRLGAYDNVVLSDCGLIGVMRWDSKDPFHGFIGKDGNLVLGPYKSINPFSSKGIAYVEDEEGWHLIDTSGKKLTTTLYRNITHHKKDYISDDPSVYVARRKDNSYISDVYSSEGKYITTIEGAVYLSVHFGENGEILYSYTPQDADDEVWKRLSDHSDFVSTEFGVSPNTSSGNSEIHLYKDDENKLGYIIGSDGSTVLRIEDFNSLGAVSDNGKYFVYSTGSYTEHYDEKKKQTISVPDITYYLYNTEAKTSTMLFTGEGYARFCGKNNDVLIASYSSDITVFGDYLNTSLYDIKNGRFLFEGSRSITYSCIGGKDYYNVCTESICVLYNEDFKPVIKSYNE